MAKFCEQNEFIAKNDDVLVGFVGWAAGGFDSTYLLTLAPSKSGGAWTDNKLMRKCILAPFGKTARAGGSQSNTTTASSTSSSLSGQTPIPSDPASAEEAGDGNDGNKNPHKDNSSGQVSISTFGVLLAFVTTLRFF